jgi:glyceraldehyde-3-phosphate dehydrogenase (NAD(P))
VKALVVGLGNVGTTLANLLLRYRSLLGVTEVVVVKGQPIPWREPDLELLRRRGATVHRGPDALDDLIDGADFVFDCRKEGAPRATRARYEAAPRLRGACAQGSERGFGVPFVSGVNEAALKAARTVQVASCNTHGAASLLRALAGPRLEELERADLVVVRRSEDLGASERLVGASVVARHRDAEAGTHHAADVRRLFSTIGVEPAVVSSDVTTPSQLMHALRFHVAFRSPVAVAEAVERIARDPLLATTMKFDSNGVFELGRRYGFQGRIYAHAVVVENNLLAHGPELRGWAFVPQEGNTLLSTLEAFVAKTRPDDAADLRNALRRELIEPRW